MRRTLTSLLALSLLFLVQAPAFAGNDTEVCHAYGGKHNKTRTMRVNGHALPAFVAIGGTAGACDAPAEDPPAEDPPAEEPPANTAPVAEATYSITSGLFPTVMLDGTASYDADGDSLTHSWVVEDHTGVVMTDSGSTASFSYLGHSYTITLTVSDGLAEDTVVLVIE